MKLMAVSLTALLSATGITARCELPEPQTCEAAINLAFHDRPAVRDRFLRIAWRESRDEPGAVNSRSGATGCLQLMPLHAWRFRLHGWSWADAKNAWRNIVVSSDLFREVGWSPWATA
jgi:hypothetical protein